MINLGDCLIPQLGFGTACTALRKSLILNICDGDDDGGRDLLAFRDATRGLPFGGPYVMILGGWGSFAPAYNHPISLSLDIQETECLQIKQNSYAGQDRRHFFKQPQSGF